MRSFEVKTLRDSRTTTDYLLWAFQGLLLKPKEIWGGIGTLLLAFLLYAGLYLAIGKPFLPPGPAWSVCIIWLLATAGSFAVERVNMPGPIGMILAGMAIGNINNGDLTKGLPASWSKELRGAALSIIFLRSGLELDLRIFKRVGPAAVRLLLIPGVLEAFFDGGLAVALFGMPATFAFAVGFILKAVGPALVIQCMFDVQQKRLGIGKAIPATVVAAASFDDMIAITGYTIFISVAVRGTGNPVWEAFHGPLSVVFGVLLGLAAAVFCSFTRLWDNHYKRTCVVVFTALVMKYFFDRYDFSSGGALGSLTLGLLVKELYNRGWPKPLASPDSSPEFSRHVEKNVRFLWRFILMPILFGLIGRSMVFATLQQSAIAKSCAIIIAGLGVRIPSTFLVMSKSGFTWKEKLFFAFAWTPKATVQATLALSPFDAVRKAYPDRNAPGAAAYYQYAQDALTLSVFCILIDGTLGTTLIRLFAPALLDKEPEESGPEKDLGNPRASLTSKPSLKRPSLRVHDPLDREENETPRLDVEAIRRQILEELGRDDAWATANAANVAGFLKQVNGITSEMEHRQALKQPVDECLAQLKTLAKSLEQSIAEYERVSSSGDVEGAGEWLRQTSVTGRSASDALRHRTFTREQQASESAV